MNDLIEVTGGKRLCGEISVQGAKNSVLPVLAACYLANGQCTVHNCPMLTDVDAAVKILRYLGCKTSRQGHTVYVDAENAYGYEISDELMHEMRSSVVFLGAILAKTGKAELSAPGGCDIGLRPIDLHISAMEKFGAKIREEHGRLYFDCPDGLKGTEIVLSFPSVGATENIMLAAVTAKGNTSIVNAACEPEISDLADFLNRCGAKIHGAGSNAVYIEGVEKLSACEHRVIPDRIAAATYMCAAAVTKGHIVLKDIIPAHIGAVISVLSESGCDIAIRNHSISVSAPPLLKKMGTVRTMPYPGFPTDAQAPVMAVASLCSGTTVFTENIFENRYRHVSELCRLGANIKVEGRVAVTEGVKALSGANVTAPDLRGGSALVIAGLGAVGTTKIDGIHHIDRGYENITENLRLLGADIKRIRDYEESESELKENISSGTEVQR